MKRGSTFSRWMKRHPVTPRLAEGERVIVAVDITQGIALKLFCPRPQRMSQDQYHCGMCGITWAIDEERPQCQSTDRKPEGDD